MYLAPGCWGPAMVNIGPLEHLAQGVLEFTAVDPVGGDLRVLARPPGRAEF